MDEVSRQREVRLAPRIAVRPARQAVPLMAAGFRAKLSIDLRQHGVSLSYTMVDLEDAQERAREGSRRSACRP
jgi:hypothetical protein